MAKNYIQPGNTVTVTAPYAVDSGDGVLVGSLFGVAQGDALISADVEVMVTGVHELAKASGAWTQGEAIYWDDVDKVATAATTSGNTKIGVCIVAADSGDATGIVRLNGSF